MYQLHHKKFKTALNDCFVDIRKIHSRNTRTKDNSVYFKHRVQTSAGKKFLIFRGIELWGKIESDVKELKIESDVKFIIQKKDKTKSYPKLYIILTFFAPYLEIII